MLLDIVKPIDVFPLEFPLELENIVLSYATKICIENAVEYFINLNHFDILFCDANKDSLSKKSCSSNVIDQF